MLRNLIPLSLIFVCTGFLSAQADDSARRYVSPADLSLKNEEAEVNYFAYHLGLLKDAYAANESSKVILQESTLMNALREEITQLNLRVDAASAQAERRKSASSGELSSAAKPAQAPARDPFAEAVTPDEIRLETMTYTLAAFERHSFDPSKPEEAARDFAKLDNILKIMQEALAELQAVRK